MSERPILFNAETVRALLDGRKTMTRRPMKPQPLEPSHLSGGENVHVGVVWICEQDHEKDGTACDATGQRWDSPFGVPGDRLWVREAWWADLSMHPLKKEHTKLFYKADGHKAVPSGNGPHGWRPSSNMPRWASRITLEVVRVWVERVQNISYEDLVAEGRNNEDDGDQSADESNMLDFEDRWNSIYDAKGYGWEKNPFCWAVEFKRVSP